ncbi:MAG: HAD family hydrolase [Tepidisphaeraceae bacterium]|jgi:HAD superfamily hydrolase (TIGR01549 family)
MIRAILFDLGDTLLNFEPMDTNAVVRQGCGEAYKQLQLAGCKLPSEARFRRMNVWSVRRALLWSKIRGREFNAMQVMRKHAVRYGAPDEDAFMLDVGWHWYQPVVPYSSIEPDLISTLQLFRSRGIKLGIVSNTFITGAILDRHLELMGLIEHLPVRIYSSEIGFRKPHPLIFNAALSAIGARPQETLFVGDVIKNDILGAGRLGMKTALKRTATNHHNHCPANYCIHRIADLIPIVLPNCEAAASVTVRSTDPVRPSPALRG